MPGARLAEPIMAKERYTLYTVATVDVQYKEEVYVVLLSDVSITDARTSTGVVQKSSP